MRFHSQMARCLSSLVAVDRSDSFSPACALARETAHAERVVSAEMEMPRRAYVSQDSAHETSTGACVRRVMVLRRVGSEPRGLLGGNSDRASLFG